ncbi:MAG: extracellular solute-binding protein [Victivallaceae bacterium]|nr:extracellular solute-binding protein [Victivallaceae bacterium]
MKEYKYNIVAKNIAEEILPELKLNALLPTPVELCARYNTSEITINRALKILVEYGFIKRVQSKGTVLIQYPENLWENQPVKPVKLSVLGIPVQFWNFMAGFESFLDRFCEINQYVSYQVSYCQAGEYPERIKNEQFDLVLVNIWALRELLTRPSMAKCFLPLDKMAGLAYDEKAYFPEIVKWCKNDQGLVCLPVMNSAVFQETNLDYPGMSRALLGKGTAWDNFIAALRTIKKENAVDGPLFWIRPGGNYWPVLLKMLGSAPFSEDGRKCLLDSPEAIAAIRKLYELVSAERLFVTSMSNGNEEQKNAFDWFATGNLACSWVSGLALGDSYDFKCSYEPLPYRKHKASHLLIEGVMVNRNTAHRDTIRYLLNFLQTAGCQEFFRHCTGVSSQKYFAQTYIDKLKPTHKGIQVVLDSLTYARPVISVPRIKVCDYVEQKLNMILLGILPLEETCRETAAEANRLLQDAEF